MTPPRHFDDGTAIAMCETATGAGDVAAGGVFEVRPSADTSTRTTPRPSWMAALGEHGDVAALVYALEVLGTPAVATGREFWLWRHPARAGSPHYRDEADVPALLRLLEVELARVTVQGARRVRLRQVRSRLEAIRDRRRGLAHGAL